MARRRRKKHCFMGIEIGEDFIDRLRGDLLRIGSYDSKSYNRYRSDGMPHHTTVKRLLGVSTWKEVLNMLGMKARRRRPKKAVVQKIVNERKVLLNKPFPVSESWLSGWEIVYGDIPHCGSCGKEIVLGEIVQWYVIKAGREEKNKFIVCGCCLDGYKEVG